MPKYMHPNFGEDKYYYISNGWGGGGKTITEYRNKVKITSLTLDSYGIKSFLSKLENNGWYNADQS